MAAKKNTKMEKALQASRTSAKNARAKSAEAVAKAAMQFGYIAGVQMHKIFNLE